MFDLSTDQVISKAEEKHFAGVYIDKNGALNTFHFVLTGSYYYDDNTKREYDTLINEYKNKIITFRNISKYDVITPRKIETDIFQVEFTDKDAIQTKCCFENYWGSVRETFYNALRNEAFSRIYSAGRIVPNMDTDLIPYLYPENASPLRLTVIDDNGLRFINGIVYHEFQEDRSDACPSCVQGFITYQETLAKISSHLIANTNEALFHGAYIHDMDVSSDKTITNALYDNFRQVIELGKIKSIRFEEIK